MIFSLLAVKFWIRLAGLAGNQFLTRNMFQPFFEMKTFTPSPKYTLSSIQNFQLGKMTIMVRHNHLLSIIRYFYNDATKLIQADN